MGRGGREGEGGVARWDICNSVSASLHVRFLHDVSSFIIPLDVSSRDDSEGGGGVGGGGFKVQSPYRKWEKFIGHVGWWHVHHRVGTS